MGASRRAGYRMKFWSFLSNPDKWIRGHIRRGLKHALFGDVIAECKGERGEYKASKAADKAFAGYNSISICDVYLPWPGGRTAQIDQIIIADSGIFVLEVKNYKGWIFGDERNQYWTQVLTTGIRGESIKNKLYNPIKQNATHISCIRRIIRNHTVPIHSVIVFSDESEFKDVTYFSSDVYVVYQSRLKSTLRDIDAQYKGILLDEDIQHISEKLAMAASRADKDNHVQKLHASQGDRKEREARGVCPRCGADLVERTAKNGHNRGAKFLGCSRYPECHYTRNIE